MEIRDLYDKNRQVTGKTFVKGSQVPKGYYYLIVIIVIENSKGEFLIQKRVANKGGKWALTGGHPKAGETSLEGIISEVKEELGIDINNKKLLLFEQTTHHDQLFDLYYLKDNINLNSIKVQVEEVDGVAWKRLEEIDKMHKNGEFHRGHYQVIQHYLEYRGRK